MRKEFTGMLPATVEMFEGLLLGLQDLDCVVQEGYNCNAGQDSYSYWGCAARIQCSDMGVLRSRAEALGVTWLSDDGTMAYTNGLTIDDFHTYRVNGNLELVPEEEEV